ncbi:hypothetical protein [Dactylosporangium sp. NPDC005555]|uniref:hypothetical protein n=1 Tax=Dactylosporangium sp. NPDC005555 TaxID=3154889 RepID=UPI0033BC8B41
MKALLFAWDRPEFRAGLRHLIDLDEVPGLLAALCVDEQDHEVERRAMDLLRSGLDTAEIRHATLLLVEDADIRDNLTAGIAGGLADRPDLARSIRSALDDPDTRADLRDALESASLRATIWRVAEHQSRGRRWALVREALILMLRHRHARRLAWSLKRHGVIRELRRRPADT